MVMCKIEYDTIPKMLKDRMNALHKKVVKYNYINPQSSGQHSKIGWRSENRGVYLGSYKYKDVAQFFQLICFVDNSAFMTKEGTKKDCANTWFREMDCSTKINEWLTRNENRIAEMETSDYEKWQVDFFTMAKIAVESEKHVKPKNFNCTKCGKQYIVFGCYSKHVISCNRPVTVSDDNGVEKLQTPPLSPVHLVSTERQTVISEQVPATPMTFFHVHVFDAQPRVLPPKKRCRQEDREYQTKSYKSPNSMAIFIEDVD